MYKLFIIVQLLLGEIPERSIFRQPALKKALIPYLHITQGLRLKRKKKKKEKRIGKEREKKAIQQNIYKQICLIAVRVGDLLQFKETMQEYSDVFKKDKTYTLILRFFFLFFLPFLFPF